MDGGRVWVAASGGEAEGLSLPLQPLGRVRGGPVPVVAALPCLAGGDAAEPRQAPGSPAAFGPPWAVCLMGR